MNTLWQVILWYKIFMNFSQTIKIYQQIFPTRIIRTKFEPGAKADVLMIATLVGTIGIQVDNYSQTYLSMQLPVHIQ